MNRQEAELTDDLHAAMNEAYDHGSNHYGHMLERAALLIEELAEQRDEAVRVLEPASDRSTAVCRAIDVLEVTA